MWDSSRGLADEFIEGIWFFYFLEWVVHPTSPPDPTVTAMYPREHEAAARSHRQ